MGKKALIRELEAALSQTLSDRAIERQRHAMVVNAMTAGMQRLTEERDEAEKNVAELLRNNETADSVIRDLRRELEGLKRERSAHSLSLLDRLAATQRERDAALGHWQNTESLLQACERELDTLQAKQEHASQWGAHFDAVMDAARAQAAPAEPVVVNAVTLQKIDALDIGEQIVCDDITITAERTGYKLQYSVDAFDVWLKFASNPKDVLKRYYEMRQAIENLAAITEPVVTLQAIQELEEGERLIEHDRMVIEAVEDGYEVWEWFCEHIFKTGPDEVYRWYLSLP